MSADPSAPPPLNGRDKPPPPPHPSWAHSLPVTNRPSHPPTESDVVTAPPGGGGRRRGGVFGAKTNARVRGSGGRWRKRCVGIGRKGWREGRQEAGGRLGKTPPVSPHCGIPPLNVEKMTPSPAPRCRQHGQGIPLAAAASHRGGLRALRRLLKVAAAAPDRDRTNRAEPSYSRAGAQQDPNLNETAAGQPRT